MTRTSRTPRSAPGVAATGSGRRRWPRRPGLACLFRLPSCTHPPSVVSCQRLYPGRECMRCVPHRFRHFLGGALVVRVSGSGDRWQWSAVAGRCDGSERKRRLDGLAVDHVGARRAAQDSRSKWRQEFAQRDATGCQASGRNSIGASRSRLAPPLDTEASYPQSLAEAGTKTRWDG